MPCKAFLCRLREWRVAAPRRCERPWHERAAGHSVRSRGALRQLTQFTAKESEAGVSHGQILFAAVANRRPKIKQVYCRDHVILLVASVGAVEEGGMRSKALNVLCDLLEVLTFLGQPT